ncbi:MAG: WhiB family transcriptional regulator [Pseudonocardiaceae bacterium]
MNTTCTCPRTDGYRIKRRGCPAHAAQTDPDGFYPEKGGSTREAKATCMRCEVRAECLEAALDRRERYGIWGGVSERDRCKMLKQRDAQAAEQETPVEGIAS